MAIGLERTGRIVTAAALLFAVSIVRALLVPALMGLLGKWNWWAPQTKAPCATSPSVTV